MPIFRYTAVDKTGKTLNGAMNAKDETELAQRLTAMGYIVRSVVGGGAAPSPQRGSIPRVTAPSGEIPPSVEPKISMRTLATCLRQIAAMIRSGMTAYQATHELTSRTRDRRLKRALETMTTQIQAGGGLSLAMAQYPELFPSHLVGLIYCGELGGFLESALDEAATYVEQETNARFWPRFAFGMMRLSIISAFMTLPTVRSEIWMNKLLEIEGTSARLQYLWGFFLDGLIHFTIPATILFLIATYAWPHIKRVPSVRSNMDFIILKVPLWGKMNMSRSLARFGKSLARLYSSGVSPGPAWMAAGASCMNSVVAGQLRSVAQGVGGGATLSSALERSKVFDDETVALLVTGEVAGDIPGVLGKVAEYNESLASSRQKMGRWISASLWINAFLIMGGVLMIMFFAGYAKVLQKLLDQASGG